jgi:hypothetical protein
MLTGLTLDEAQEFAKLDDTMPYDGAHVWPTTGLPSDAVERRWLELWTKQSAAQANAGRRLEAA